MRKRAKQYECKVPTTFYNKSTILGSSSSTTNTPNNNNNNNITDRYEELEDDAAIEHFLSTTLSLPSITSSSNRSTTDSHNNNRSSSNSNNSYTTDDVTPFDKKLERMGLLPWGSITTTRKRYQMGKFTIDFDSTDFGYQIGEIELMVVNTQEKKNSGKDNSNSNKYNTSSTTEAEEIEDASKQIVEFCRENGLDISKGIHGKVLEYIRANRPQHYLALKQAGLVQRKVFKEQ